MSQLLQQKSASIKKSNHASPIQSESLNAVTNGFLAMQIIWEY